MPTYGIEEEVFVTEPERPTVRSLFFLAKLLARNPAFYYTHSASNFARGKDLKQGLMSGVELSTGVHDNIDSLLEDFAARRKDLSAVTDALIVPMGHLLDYNAPSNTCSLQIHVGTLENFPRVYNNLCHFMPILPLFTINSPTVSGDYFGQSYRMKASFAVGPIQDDWTVRFQDIIFSKRLGTIEIRVCDPCWDMKRITQLVRCVSAIAELEVDLDPNPQRYNAQRDEMCSSGLLDESADLVNELKAICDFPVEMLEKTASDELYEVYKSDGLVAAYSALDNGYRNGVFEPRPISLKQKRHITKGVLGFIGYYLARFPYYAWKGLVE